MNNSKMKLYRDRFNHIREGQFIYSNGDIDPFVFTRKGLKWRCLYSQKHKSRNKLPKYLFISDKGNVISVFGEVPAHITQYLNNDRYARIGSGNGNSYGVGKPLYIHILVAIVYGSPMTLRARKLLAEKGYDAFGIDDTHNCLKVHHKDKNTLNNSPENLIIMTGLEHKWLHNIENAIRWFWSTKSVKLTKKKQKEYAEIFG